MNTSQVLKNVVFAAGLAGLAGGVEGERAVPVAEVADVAKAGAGGLVEAGAGCERGLAIAIARDRRRIERRCQLLLRLGEVWPAG